MKGRKGWRVAGIVLAAFLVAAVCLAIGLAVGGGIGFAIGREDDPILGHRRGSHVEVVIPGGEDWYQAPHWDFSEMGKQPYLGVRYETVQEGARIVVVEPDAPAERAGLREDDVILAVDGEPVGAGQPTLAERIQAHEPGDAVELRVLRGEDEIDVEAVLEARHAFSVRVFPSGGSMPPIWIYPSDGEERAYLGVRIEQKENGAEVLEVLSASPAEEAGLEEGDVILAVDGETATRENTLYDILTGYQPGDTATLTVERDGREIEVEVELAECTDDALTCGPWPLPGGAIRILPGEDAEQGVLILDVVEDSPAEEAGLQDGDLITAVDGEPVGEPQKLADAIADHEPGDTVTLTVYRLGDGAGDAIGEEREVEVTLAEHPDEAGKAYLGIFPGGFFVRMHEGRGGWWPHHEGRSSLVVVSDDPGNDENPPPPAPPTRGGERPVPLSRGERLGEGGRALFS